MLQLFTQHITNKPDTNIKYTKITQGCKEPGSFSNIDIPPKKTIKMYWFVLMVMILIPDGKTTPFGFTNKQEKLL